MIHPNTELRFINAEMGYGVFASSFIPQGSIVYIMDPLEREISPQEFAQLPGQLKEATEKYSFIDERGYRIVSWDMAKYVNHCCQCNTMSTGYGFEIALRDIREGEEITDEYGLFNLESEMQVYCGKSDCRMVVKRRDHLLHTAEWDEQIKVALRRIFKVEQPLAPLLEKKTRDAILQFLDDEKAYYSVSALFFHTSGPTDSRPYQNGLLKQKLN